MSTPRQSPLGSALALAMALFPLAGLAQDAAAPRSVAPLPAELPDSGEPTPPSPVVADDAAGTPGLEADFGIGRPATAEEIAAIDIDATPDGQGLPDGRGSYAEGKALYDERCVACHGENLEGIPETGGPALIGGRDTLAGDKPLKTVESYLAHASTLYDYIHRAMPMDAPGSLTPDQVYAISAYILGRAGILDETAVLDRETLPQVRMPNAEGFTADPRPERL
ncbi:MULTISPECIES: cytochrome c [Paracoccus]|uniref:c-type cytochrome n=1 Tax=Paracoccus TaxID=265 RepID=UPI001FB79C90|nr:MULTISPECIES: cytochrome c [Paracoccus]MCJ1901987.1 cytochrome c [Paracoccus versutus]MDF3904371.1 cytochrome c [Paracoccus sp. AS002]